MSQFEDRDYQIAILNFLKSCDSERKNAIVELDCGLGKRIITLKIVTELYPTENVLILLHSTSSLAETLNFFKENISNTDFGWLDSRTSSPMRIYILKSKRVVLATPRLIANILRKSPQVLDRFRIIVINEVDKIVRRMGTQGRVIVQPWPKLLPLLSDKFVIGMSGTFRDTHFVMGANKKYEVEELVTLKAVIPNSKLILMDSIQQMIKKYMKYTFVYPYPIEKEEMRKILIEIDNEVSEVIKLLRAKNNDRNILTAVQSLSPEDELRQKFSKLTMLRKYLVALPIKSAKKYFLIDNYIKKRFYALLPKIRENPKIPALFNLLNTLQGKVVILTSYKATVRKIEEMAKKRNMTVFTLTGESFNKSEILDDFRNAAGNAILVLSPVGERDLDFSGVKNMIILDVINTTKTMYQRIKRIRGGEIYVFFFKGTSEERKVKRLLRNIKERYYWSTKISFKYLQELRK